MWATCFGLQPNKSHPRTRIKMLTYSGNATATSEGDRDHGAQTADRLISFCQWDQYGSAHRGQAGGAIPGSVQTRSTTWCVVTFAERLTHNNSNNRYLPSLRPSPRPWGTCAHCSYYNRHTWSCKLIFGLLHRSRLRRCWATGRVGVAGPRLRSKLP